MDPTNVESVEVPHRISRLSHVLPDFTRVIWVSEKAKEMWEPRISAICKAWDDLELRAAEVGLRLSALKSVAPEHLLALVERGLKNGFTAIPLSREGSIGGTYQASSQPVVEGRPWTYRVAYTEKANAGEWLAAWKSSDDQKIGQLLGYPECCVKFFHHFWVQEKYVDTTYPMSLGGTEGPVEANHLLRWLGVRLVPHLPHSHNCEETVRQANQYLELGHKNGFSQEMNWALEMLSWPVEWSALHGIAEIRIPVLKISTRTDATTQKVVIQKQGTKYPTEGASGIVFPYLPPKGVRLTMGPSFKRSLKLDDEWRQNGFSSKESMDAAHQVLLDTLKGQAFSGPGRVFDLGCGNGVLLEKVCTMFPGLVPCGIDSDRERALAAYRRLPSGEFGFGDLHDVEKWPHGLDFDLVLLYPGRLLEEPDLEKRKQTLERILDRGRTLLCYSYSDNMSVGLLKMMDQAGIRGVAGTLKRSSVAESVLVNPV